MVAATVLVVIASACGGTKATSTGPAPETADQSLAATAAAFAKLGSYHMAVGAAKLRLSLDASSGAEHAFQTLVEPAPTGSVTFEYIEVGTHVYFHGLAFLRLQGVADRYPQVGSNWYLATNTDGSSGLNTFLDPAKAAHCLIERHGALSFGETTTVNGVAAVAIVAAAGGAGSTPETFYLSADGHHTLMRVVQTGPTVNGGDSKDTCENIGADPQKAGSRVTIDFTQ
ncbi:MAG TPA: hypothetical protein VFO60_11775, partial [Candidatus Dormibacteraeota bacterium]|nr:hypothetical protein [Candidatus Dormibacteraeota bacterium]